MLLLRLDRVVDVGVVDVAHRAIAERGAAQSAPTKARRAGSRCKIDPQATRSPRSAATSAKGRRSRMLRTALLRGAAAPALARRGLAAPSALARHMSVMTGSCKWFNSEKGFGFVLTEPEDGSEPQEIFVHFSQVKAKEFRGRPGFRSLAEGEPLEFEIEENDDGKVCAVNVTGPNGDPVQGAPPPPRRDDYGYDDVGYGGGYDDYGGGYGGGGRGRRGGSDDRLAALERKVEEQGRTITALKRAIEGGDDYPEEELGRY